ncbi:MAG: glycosyltransferase family 4 protein [Candidatus Dormibacteraeota bacterium]|nr:glycosyltransferase family 4 protein [Candidatus Dormibacteraeota bacterium]
MIRAAFEAAGATVVHVNTQDRRSVFNVGVLDFRNVILGLAHAVQTAWLAARFPVKAVYLSISQGRWGYVRDAILISIVHMFRRPLVVHLRGAKLQDFYRSASALERRVVRRTLGWADMAIALTPGLRSVYDGLVPSDRVRVLENTVADPWPSGIASFSRCRQERATSNPGELRILYVANDFATKGAETLIRSIAEPGLEATRLTMVGEPPQGVARRALHLAEELGVSDRLELTGGLSGSDKRRAFERADVFAYPTENDGQPLVIIEALAAGLPIVTSMFGGVPETVGAAALLVEPRDVVNLAVSLRRLIQEPPLREELGRAARERYLDRYTPEAFQERFVELFAELMPAHLPA